jgi:hypothetical protein
MKSERVWKHFILAALLALGGYALLYYGLEHQRTRRGPWEVTFTNTPAGAPAIAISQPRLGITNVQISFPDQSAPPTNAPRTIIFGQPQPVPFEVPFGKCVFMDTMSLPGTVTFQFFGHEIELLPRVLVIDHQEHRWVSDSAIALEPVPNPKAEGRRPKEGRNPKPEASSSKLACNWKVGDTAQRSRAATNIDAPIQPQRRDARREDKDTKPLRASRLCG